MALEDIEDPQIDGEDGVEDILIGTAFFRMLKTGKTLKNFEVKFDKL